MSDAADIPRAMTAMLLTGHGGDDKLAYRTDVPVPRPTSGEVLIRVGAAGVNNTDIATRLGWYARTEGGDGGWRGGIAFPRIQGADVCGTIVATGDGVAASRIGERVLVQPCLRSLRADGRDPWLGSERDGGFAQYVTAPAADTWRIDSTLSDAELASFPCSYATAENLLTRAGVVAGERVLITGASGGVGSAAVQLAVRRRAHVVAVAAAAKAAACLALGASRVIGRDAELPADSFDVVIDVVGGTAFAGLLDVLKPRGRYATSGAIAGALVALDLRALYLNDLTLFGCTAQDDGVFAALIGYIERREIRPLLARTFPLMELAAAQRDFAAKRHVGKLVVIPPH
jgi:NADPH:quinone reductase-like Zn-dependent oxidoreductase